MTVEEEIAEMQRDHAAWMAHRRFVAIVVGDNGEFIVHDNRPNGVAPQSDYPTARLAAARVLQLLLTGPVAPQTHPEEVFVGGIDTMDTKTDE